MRTIKTTSGHEIALDGDLLAVLEALFTEVTAKRELERSYEDLTREIEHLISQMTPEEVQSYFAESLFLNQVKYENDKLESLHAQARTEVSRRSVASVPELPGDPVYLLLALVDRGHALRRAHRLRLRRPVRQARARRFPHDRR